jgi:hypothetical protein
VLDDDGRDVALEHVLLHAADQRPPLLQRHAGRRLVEQDEVDVGDHRPCELDELALRVAELLDGPVRQAQEIELFEELQGSGPALLARRPGPASPPPAGDCLGTGDDVLVGRHRPEQLEVLERPRQAEVRAPVGAHAAELAAPDQDLPGRVPVEAEDRVHQGGLAKRAEQRQMGDWEINRRNRWPAPGRFLRCPPCRRRARTARAGPRRRRARPMIPLNAETPAALGLPRHGGRLFTRRPRAA